MSIHVYNIKEAEVEIRALLEDAVARPTVIDRAAYTAQAAIKMMDDDHRAAVLLFPQLVAEMQVHIATTAAHLAEVRDTGAVGAINFQVYNGLLEHASDLIQSYTPADDCDSYFTAPPKECFIAPDGAFVEAAGASHHSLVAWVRHNAIPHETIVAHIYDTQVEELSCGCMNYCDGRCECYGGW